VTPRALRVGLTGGIASGKSAVADRLASHGATIIDADRVAREVVEPGQPALAEVLARFGADLLGADGRLDRAALRRKVFDDPAERRALEAILHPRIRALVRARAEAARGPYCVVAVPLLVESGGDYGWLDLVVVVDVPEPVQLARLMARDGLTEPLARAMIEAQASRERRLQRADEVVRNDGTLADLHRAVDALHLRLLARANALRA
jgi:dephospho-CoA kinase